MEISEEERLRREKKWWRNQRTRNRWKRTGRSRNDNGKTRQNRHVLPLQDTEEAEEKPLSDSEINAIAESTVNQLLMRDQRRSEECEQNSAECRSRSRTRSRSRGTSLSCERSRSRGSCPSKEGHRSRDQRPGALNSRLDKLKDPKIVTLKGLKSFHKESDIRKMLVEERMKFRDIRVIFNKANQSGTAFVEFRSEDEAARWVRNKRGMLVVVGEYLTMDLNKPETASKEDWLCELCREKNHYARYSCFSCQSVKQEVPEKTRKRSQSLGEEKHDDSKPSNVLMLRGLDYLTTEEQIHRKLRDITTVPIKDLRIISDKFTNKFRGICLVEVASVAEGKELMRQIEKLNPPFEISNRNVKVRYQHEPGKKAADAAVAPVQWSVTNEQDVAPATVMQSNDKIAAAQQELMPQTVGAYMWDKKSGYYYDQSSGLYYDPKTKYYHNPTDKKYYYWNEKTQKYEAVNTDTNTQTDEHTQLTSLSPAENTGGSTGINKLSYNKAAEDMSAEKIQEVMGQWTKARDKVHATGAKIPRFMEHCAKIENREQAKKAKKLIKNMERWAKSKNRQFYTTNSPRIEPEKSQTAAPAPKSGNGLTQHYANQIYQQGFPTTPPPPNPLFPITNMSTSIITPGSVTTATPTPDTNTTPAPVAMATSAPVTMTTALVTMTTPTHVAMTTPTHVAMTTAHVAMTDEQINRKHEDLTAIACLLCKRKFPTVNNLRRHQQLSDLHRTSLATERQKMSAETSVLDYRDRAAERRSKFSTEPAPVRVKRRGR